MNDPRREPEAASGEDAQLVAYLDGELDDESRAALERRLGDDAPFRQRLQQLQQVWDVLDVLPRATADESFTRTTLELAVVRDAGQAARPPGGGRLWAGPRLRRLATLAVAGLAGYLVVAVAVQRPQRQMLRDLPVIENLDVYQYVDSVEFLRMLEREGLFPPEEHDVP